ncbi:unnamed protein product [Blepharisma stoltei]|uniref:Uncharacterized protein n=1 Tax=Blepharisma stoltei TaxID=1481888 RepID=A0AAU9K2M5_9CILI|nr:unnamed protein product [Blepharisma stoltei]
MSAGGNSAFHHFLLNYKISRETPIFALKYKTKAAEYYRAMLDALSENLQYDVDFPSVELGIQLINENSPSYSPNTEMLAPQEYSEIPIQPPLAENIGNVQVPPIENEERPKGWKSWIKAKYTNSVQFGDKVFDKFNNFVSTNPTMKKLDEQGTKAANKINEEVKKFSQHPHVQYVENIAKNTTNHLTEEAKSSYNYLNPKAQKVRNAANNFFIGIESKTKNLSSAAMNYIKNKRNQGPKIDGEVEHPLLQNENPVN